jgi:acetyl esterase/lipase
MKKLLIFTFLFASLILKAQQAIPLYNGDIPNSIPNRMKEIVMQNGNILLGYRNIANPTLSVFLPPAEKATGMAVIICPGGGYAMETYSVEGTVIAEAFTRQGIAAFVLKYRLPSDSIMHDKTIGPLQDAQQAIKTVRQRSAEWKINPDKIGIMGFSAGGHLAATAGTHFNKSYIPNDENINLRPDFLILIYPVISMKTEITHAPSRHFFLGDNPSQEQIDLFSNELHVDEKTPPAWITHAGDDTMVPVENSIRFYQALIKNKVPAEMHLYPKGNHGFVSRQDPDEWMKPLFNWLNKEVL